MQAVVLAAGMGKRMRSRHPKVLHEIFGRPVLATVLETLVRIGVRRPLVVIGNGADEVRGFLKNWCRGDSRIAPTWVLQRPQRGTGHAVMTAAAALRKSGDPVLIWPADTPLLQASTLRRFIRHHEEGDYEASVLSALQLEPRGYGRILRAGGSFYAIREELDASESEKKVQEVNTGVYLFKAACLLEALGRIRPVNKKKEFYLTDTIELVSKQRAKLEAFPFAASWEARGINSRKHLAEVIQGVNKRQIEDHQHRGVTFIAPDQTFVGPEVRIGQDTVIYPWCYIESGVRIGRDCQIGPFAKIRKGTTIDDGAVIGSFVEVARSHIGKKVLAKHLTYLGDAEVGAGTNVGAGTITANFDGKNKRKTHIGKKVLIGSNTVFVAPVHVGDEARTGAGAVVTRGSRVKRREVVVGVPARPLREKTRRVKK